MKNYDITEEEYISLSDLFSAFSDTTRLKIMIHLLNGEKTVSEICQLTSFSQSAVSHQLKKLRLLKLVKGIKSGKYTIYSLDDEHIETMVSISIEHMREI